MVLPDSVDTPTTIMMTAAKDTENPAKDLPSSRRPSAKKLTADHAPTRKEPKGTDIPNDKVVPKAGGPPPSVATQRRGEPVKGRNPIIAKTAVAGAPIRRATSLRIKAVDEKPKDLDIKAARRTSLMPLKSPIPPASGRRVIDSTNKKAVLKVTVPRVPSKLAQAFSPPSAAPESPLPPTSQDDNLEKTNDSIEQDSSKANDAPPDLDGEIIDIIDSNNELSRLKPGVVIKCDEDTFKLLSWLRDGSSARGGSVWLALSTNTSRCVAIKFGHIGDLPYFVMKELMAYSQLKHIRGLASVSHYGMWYGQPFFVMDALGPDLLFWRQSYNHECVAGGPISPTDPISRAVAAIGQQMLIRLRDVHNRNMVHGNIQPANILFEPGRISDEAPLLYLINFATSSPWRTSSGQHRPLRQDRTKIFCSPAFASLPCLQGVAPCRRDDIESLAYVLIYLLRGNLPWAIDCPSDKNDQAAHMCSVRDAKLALTPSKLCEGLPQEFADFLEYARSMKFDAQPQYDRWSKVFLNMDLKGRGSQLAYALKQQEDLFMVKFPYAYATPDVVTAWCKEKC